MRINHLIIGCEDVKKSQAFYMNVLGFEYVSSFVDTGTKKEGLVLLDKSSGEEVEILLVPFNDERLPSPQHIAFEIDSKKFDSIFNVATDMKLDIRSMPPLDCKIKGIGRTEVRGRNFERFYLLDPSRVNIEFMRLC
jgi:catechol 2,3-dioxygenase-like lactoylglutathione lyase family enzyme